MAGEGVLEIVRGFEASGASVSEIPWEHREAALDLLEGRGREWLEKAVASRGEDLPPDRCEREGRPMAPAVYSLRNAQARRGVNLAEARLEHADTYEVLWWARRLGVTAYDLKLESGRTLLATRRALSAALRLLDDDFYRVAENRRRTERVTVRAAMREACDEVRSELRRLQRRPPHMGGGPVYRWGRLSDRDRSDLRSLYTDDELASWRSLYTEGETLAVWPSVRFLNRHRAMALAPETKEPEGP